MKATKYIEANTVNLSEVATKTANYFMMQGYTASSEQTPTGQIVYITKGGFFKTVSGLRTSLNIELSYHPNGVFVTAGVGLFKQQFIATVLTLFVAWPFIIPQIWGIIKQAGLDDEAIEVVEQFVNACPQAA